MARAAILWTGGKDSALALAAVAQRHEPALLVTFVPDPPRPFLAHPLDLVAVQALAVGLPHRAVPVREPYAAGYEAAIAGLAREGIEVLVSGDIDRVAGQPNWIEERARGLVATERPLWGADRPALLHRLLAEGWDVVCTLAYDEHFAPTIAGRRFDGALVGELSARHGAGGFDACGENGEYHSAVLDGPLLHHPVELLAPRVVAGDGHHRLEFAGVRLGAR